MKTATQLLGKATAGWIRSGTVPKAASQGLSHLQEVGRRGVGHCTDAKCPEHSQRREGCVVL